MARPAALTVCLLALVLQLGQLARRAAHELPKQARWADAIAGRTDDPVEGGLEFWHAAAWRDVPAAAAAVPAGEPLLLLTQVLVPVRYDYLLLPRELSELHGLDPALLAALAQRYPRNAYPLRRRFESLERDGRIATPERLLEELGRHDWVLVFESAPPLPEGAPDLELVAEAGRARVFRVRREDEGEDS